MACTNNSLESCGRLFADQLKTNQSVIFDAIKITLKVDGFVESKDFFLMPSSQDLYLNPLKVSEFRFSDADGR